MSFTNKIELLLNLQVSVPIVVFFFRNKVHYFNLFLRLIINYVESLHVLYILTLYNFSFSFYSHPWVLPRSLIELYL